MITEENGVFHIRTETYSYLFKIDTYGLAEHLHFGAPVKTRDAGALSCRPGPGWGASILLDAKDTASCPDVLPLEWSGSGRSKAFCRCRFFRKPFPEPIIASGFAPPASRKP